MRARPIDWLCLTLVIVGAINWGLIGFFQYDLVAGIFGGMSATLSRFVYVLVGAAGLYCLSMYHRVWDRGADRGMDSSTDNRSRDIVQ